MPLSTPDAFLSRSPRVVQPSERRAMLSLALCGLDMALVCGFLGHRLFLQNPVWVYLTCYALLFGLYVYMAGRLLPRLSPRYERFLVPAILGCGLLLRLLVLPAPPSLSTDMFRYVWDGRLTLHGINPYRYVPLAPELAYLRDSIWEQMEYKPYQTIYMPVSQFFFALGNALFGSNLTAFKALYTLFDAGVMMLIVRLLSVLGRPRSQVVWYALCPLPICEISLAGHQDVVGVFLLLLAFLLSRQERTRGWGAVALVASILTKGFGLLLLPLFARTYGKKFVLWAAVAFVYLGLPLWVYLPEFQHGMKQYLNNVHVNGGIFSWLDAALHPLTTGHSKIAQLLGDFVIGTASLWAARRPAVDFHDLLRRTFVVLSVTLLSVPTLFPWYLLWPLCLCPLLGQRPSWALVLLTGTVVLLYIFYVDMYTYWWVSVLEYVPFYALLVWEGRRWRREQNLLPEIICA